METRSQDVDRATYALALMALGTAGLAFVATRNGAALVMTALCTAGLVGARLLVRTPGPLLLPVALGLCGVLWLVWISPVDQYVSPAAHLAGGVLVGWMLAETARARGWPAWPILALGAVFLLTLVWEVGEYVGDRALDTALIPSKRDSAFDVFFGTVGGTIGVTIAVWRFALVTPVRER
jgi:hypothetical protein